MECSKPKKIIIAIDGFSSCGKSTFAKTIAAKLGYIFIDTGAMYRAVTLYALEHGAIVSGIVDEEKVIALLDDISIDFRFNPERGASDIYVNGDRAEGRIRTIEVSNCVSRVSSIRQVREKLVAMQQAMGRQRGVVMDGRDIGTVVFPNAEMKIFMTADPEVRARRRYDELLAKGSTSRVLFTLDGKAYGGKEFAGFAAVYPAGTRRQLEAFTVKTILDYENSRLELKHPEFCALVQGHRDSMLLAEITDREVGKRSVVDEAGLKAYFEAHRSDFHWDEPRYKGIVLHCTTKRVAKQVRKFLKQIPEEEWMDAIRLTFNAGDTPKVQAEQGLFAPGDNAYVDDLVFKGKDATPVLSFPFTAVQGRKQKGPDSWQEVREPLVTAYRNYLETHWVAKLRAAGKVEIDQEVLKTVNNH